MSEATPNWAAVAIQDLDGPSETMRRVWERGVRVSTATLNRARITGRVIDTDLCLALSELTGISPWLLAGRVDYMPAAYASVRLRPDGGLETPADASAPAQHRAPEPKTVDGPASAVGSAAAHLPEKTTVRNPTAGRVATKGKAKGGAWPTSRSSR